MRINKILFHILIIFILGIFQLVVLRNFSFLSSLNLILCFIIFFVLFDYRLSFFWSLFGGFILSFYSFYPFGTYIVLFLFVSYFAHYLFKKFFPRYSLVSLTIFSFLSLLIYQLSFTFLSFLFYKLGIIQIPVVLNKIFFTSLLNTLILNTAVIVIITFLFTLLEKRK